MNELKPVIECRSCGVEYSYRRERRYSWLSSRRCPSCGDEHDSSAALEQTVARDTSTDADKQLYLMYDGQRVKVGISESVERRLTELQLGNPDVTLLRVWDTPDARHAELSVHGELHEYQVDREWFDCPPSVAMDAITDVLADGADEGMQTELSSWAAVA